MRFSYCILMSAILLSGCSTSGNLYTADRSDKVRMHRVEKKPEERRGGWYPHPDFPGGHPPHNRR